MKLWLRELGHFFGYLIGYYVIAWVAEANTTLAWAAVIKVWALLLIAAFTIRGELREYNQHKQGKLKTCLDITFKVGAYIAAFATSVPRGWW